MEQFFIPMVKLDAIEQILIIDVMEQFVPSIPMKLFIPVEQFFVPMVRLDPVEQILIFVLMEQFVQFVPMK